MNELVTTPIRREKRECAICHVSKVIKIGQNICRMCRREIAGREHKYLH